MRILAHVTASDRFALSRKTTPKASKASVVRCFAGEAYGIFENHTVNGLVNLPAERAVLAYGQALAVWRRAAIGWCWGRDGVNL